MMVMMIIGSNNKRMKTVVDGVDTDLDHPVEGVQFCVDLLDSRTSHNQFLDNLLIFTKLIRQFPELVLELVKLDVLDIEVVLGRGTTVGGCSDVWVFICLGV